MKKFYNYDEIDKTLIISEYDTQCVKKLINLKNTKKFFEGLFRWPKYGDLAKWLIEKTPLLDEKYSFQTRLYWVLHGMTEFPRCPFYDGTPCELGKDMYIRKNIEDDNGWSRSCTPECPRMKKQKQEKIEATMLKNYGSKNFFSSEKGKKVKQDWCEAQGVTNPFQLESVKEISRKARKEHFGYEYTMQSPEKRQLAADNYFEKTGYDHQFKNPEVKAKSEKTIQDKKDAGIDLYEKRRIGNRIRRYQQFCENDEVNPIFSLKEFQFLTDIEQHTTLFKWHCNKCNSDFEEYIDQNFCSRDKLPARCPNCHPRLDSAHTSKAEWEVINFIKSLTDDIVIDHDKTILKPRELDVYLPEKKLAFEYDGVFWHRDEGNDIYKQLFKTEVCEKQGIQLIHIFENEWILNKDVVKSRIQNLLGIYDKIVFARKCEIHEVTASESRKFQEENHLQGAVNSKVNLGLYFQDELISLMTFSKPRFDKKHEWELVRFCNKLGYHIPGAAGKLLKHFEKTYKPKNLVSYADRRWSQGKLYKKLGFTLDHISAPDYWYFKGNTLNLESRVKYQKHRLSKLLPTFNSTLTEVQNMENNGYYRIFDCGNLVFVKMY